MRATHRPGPSLLRRLRREDGAVTIPTIFWLPLFFMIMLAGVEMMVTNLRQLLLERAVDVATRELRIGNMVNLTHDQLKQKICAAIRFVPDCTANLAVEIFPVDTTTWQFSNTGRPLCTDSSSTDVLNPTLDYGGSNQLMVVRACLKLKTMSDMDPLGAALVKDSSGRFALVAMTAYVNEPRE
ncbi:TadE/TadG family type IV pilus assembly protein [Paenirhodobacter hankyongi]|uniref:Pilus assembly protein n=1 Tax=Paenirhodobacter hankyongi TaxID=2294033 RepID=A0A421BQL4_9RHOB|nr:hypothetical protein [Sinirhodobacter hankyongi]RLL65243.1 hypothetical protein DYS74_07925 [Sinirhodobacter hankyongi]